MHTNTDPRLNRIPSFDERSRAYPIRALLETKRERSYTWRCPIVGGHAILCHGYNQRGGYYKVHNSWGEDWGRRGEARISREDMRLLLGNSGEACIPIKRHR